jgi:plastocyanin
MRPHRLLFFVALVGCFLSFVAPTARVGGARSGAIRGRVDLRRIPPAAEPRPNVADLGTAAAAAALDISDRLRSVVYLESAPRGAFETVESTHAVMDQRGERFVPHVLAITTGTTVDFPNSDHIYHNVFSLSKPKPFDLGRYPTGHSKPMRFDRPGIVRVFCEIHSHMNAFILVFSHPFFSLTDNEGRFHIDNIPPGTYNVIAWNEGMQSEPRAVTVPDGGVAEEDFVLK